MTKKQLKERALLLFSFAFLMEGLRQLELIDEKTKEPTVDLSKLEDRYDIKLISIYKKLKRLRPSFANKKVSNFFYKKIEKISDDISQDCLVLLIGLIGIYFYQKFKRTNEFVLDISTNEIEEIFNEINKENEITECTINKAIEIIESIYPDEKGLIEFYKLTDRFPFNLLKDDKNVLHA